MIGCTPLEVSVNSQTDIHTAILIKTIAITLLTCTNILKKSKNCSHISEEYYLEFIKTDLLEN